MVETPIRVCVVVNAAEMMPVVVRRQGEPDNGQKRDLASDHAR